MSKDCSDGLRVSWSDQSMKIDDRKSIHQSISINGISIGIG